MFCLESVSVGSRMMRLVGALTMQRLAGLSMQQSESASP